MPQMKKKLRGKIKEGYYADFIKVWIEMRSNNPEMTLNARFVYNFK